MSVLHFRLSTSLTVCRSDSVYRSFSALTALIQFSTISSSPYSDVYPSFAADGRIFQLEDLAHSLTDSCSEKEYLLALVGLGQAAFVAQAGVVLPFNASKTEKQRFANSLRTEILRLISLQQCVSSNLKYHILTFFPEHTVMFRSLLH